MNKWKLTYNRDNIPFADFFETKEQADNYMQELIEEKSGYTGFGVSKI